MAQKLDDATQVALAVRLNNNSNTDIYLSVLNMAVQLW